jgi:putative N6-adenine-specific DNA methylase
VANFLRNATWPKSFLTFARMVPEGRFEMVAKTLAGFEDVLADEIWALGGSDIQVMRRAVSFRGDKELMYRANLWLRTALRILVPFHYATANNASDLYKRAYRVKWSDYMTVRDTFAIDCIASGELFQHSLFAAMKVKDAIADQFVDRQRERPSVDLENPTLRINLHIHDAEIIFALDSSGDSLHKRGYRLEKNEAPLNEITAAGMVLLTGWKGKSNFVDPMCGSGTLLIEAAGIAMDLAPGLCREGFGFQRWADYDESLWNSLLQEAKDRIHPPSGTISGSDVDAETVDIARRNIERAGLKGHVQVRCQDFTDARPPAGGGLLVTNPPYGERMEVEEIEDFYKSLGNVLKQHYKGFDAWVLSGNTAAIKRIGLRANKKIPLLNGGIECRFHKFELYDGTREKA